VSQGERARGERPLLEVKGLTLRFRGLVAVNNVDLTVREGDIAAVIGPNGAGKTSLFNAITGIYDPSEGVVCFEGRDLEAPLEPRLYLRWTFIGLAVALFLFLFVADVDKMWSAVVKPNYKGKVAGFQFDHAMDDLGDYLWARPRIDQKAGRFYVVTFDGQTPFGSSRTREEALARRDAILEMAELDGTTTLEPVTPGALDGPHRVHSADRQRILDEGPNREMLESRLRVADELKSSATAAVVKRLVALVLGFFLGFAGGYAVWRQTRRTPTSVAERGIARTFQNIRLFQDMTVLENVLVAMDRHLAGAGLWTMGTLRRVAAPLALLVGCLLLALATRFEAPNPLIAVVFFAFAAGLIAYIVRVGRIVAFSKRDLEVEAEATGRARTLLDGVGLGGKVDELASNLAYGNQRRLEIARALATRPRLLLLDEPAAGMNPSESVALMGLIRKIRDDGVTVLLIEHHMRVVMGISDRIAVLEYGQKIAEGTPEEIRSNARVIEAYLGKEELG
jgi:branched-chain amino acid transport system ATP-binding protein